MAEQDWLGIAVLAIFAFMGGAIGLARGIASRPRCKNPGDTDHG